MMDSNLTQLIQLQSRSAEEVWAGVLVEYGGVLESQDAVGYEPPL